MDFNSLSPHLHPPASSASNSSGISGINLLSFQPVPPDHPGQDFLLNQSSNSNPMSLDLESTVSLANSIVTSNTSTSSSFFSMTKSLSKGQQRKRKSNNNSSNSSLVGDASDIGIGGGAGEQSSMIKAKDLKNFVLKLLTHKCETFPDPDFAERAMMNLARKIASNPKAMSDWEQSISQPRDPSGTASSNECIGVSRPKDGRMTVAKSSVASTKKVFPQIVLCQIFRWPQIVFHNDIKSSPECQFQVAIKPPNESVDVTDQLICINPYHYVITPEAKVRFRKAANRANDSSTSDAFARPLIVEKTNKKSNMTSRKRSSVKLNLDEGFDEGGEPQVFDSQGIDYLKLWEEGTKSQRDQIENKIQSFNPEEIMREIKFLNIENGNEIDDKLRDKLNVKKEIERIIRGDYLDQVFKANKKDAKGTLETVPNTNLEEPEKQQEEPLKQQEEPLKQQKENKEVGPGKSDLPRPPPPDPPAPPPAQEDSAIQDLLDDIRGSFERQFDDEFEDLTTEDLADADSVAPTLTFGGDIEQSFNFSQQQQQQQQLQQVVDQDEEEDLPCIVESWTVNQQHPQLQESNNPDFLNPDSISQDDFENFFPPPGHNNLSHHPHHTQEQQQFDMSHHHQQHQHFQQQQQQQQYDMSNMQHSNNTQDNMMYNDYNNMQYQQHPPYYQ